jgi:hypothetical protein
LEVARTLWEETHPKSATADVEQQAGVAADTTSNGG